MRRATQLVLLAVALASGPPPACAEPNRAALEELRGAATAPAPGRDDTQPASQPATATAPATPPTSAPAEEAGFLQRLRDAGAAVAAAAARLYLYFGPVGVASVAVWVLVWATLLVQAIRTRGMGVGLGASLLAALAVAWAHALPQAGPFVAFLIWLAVFAALAVVVAWALVARELPVAFAALMLALAAFGLGMWNSDNVSAIREDRTAEIEAARKRQMAARRRDTQEKLRKLKSKAADIRFAEDDANDPLDLAGYRKKDAALLARGPEAGDYAYRAGGKRRRDPNMLDGKADALTRAVDDEAKGSRLGAGARMLPGDDLVRANQLDRLNRFAVRMTLVAAVLFAGLEYLRRLNRTVGSILPLPISCRAIDSIWPKTHAVRLRARSPDDVRRYLEAAVRKGESFLCFAPRDPWPGERGFLDRLPVAGLWQLRKVACRPSNPAYGSGLVFESAWYGRCSFVILAGRLDASLSAFLDDLLAALRMRRHTRAAAARSVHLVWDLPAPPPPETLEELAFLCRETNWKLVIVGPDEPDAAARGALEETCAC